MSAMSISLQIAVLLLLVVLAPPTTHAVDSRSRPRDRRKIAAESRSPRIDPAQLHLGGLSTTIVAREAPRNPQATIAGGNRAPKLAAHPSDSAAHDHPRRERHQAGRHAAAPNRKAESVSKNRRARDGTHAKEKACSPCGEVYVVSDAGETLQTISVRCHAPSIVEDNPHITDYDDLAPGAVLLISSPHAPCSNNKLGNNLHHMSNI